MLKKDILITSILFIIILAFHWNIPEKISQETKNQKLIHTYYQEQPLLPNRTTTYIGVLELPSIHLKQGFYEKTSNLNQVDKNMELINECNPNSRCDFILASHSGNSPISYFKDLDKLQKEDKAILDYKHQLYTYTLAQEINQKKTGFLSLEKKNSSRLILTTCDKQNDAIQKVYIFEKEET
ncbi:MAG: sortase [Bacilli bacterium]|nr:sortase [Bacilli bacterium]MBR1817232.1 sortase [Bacilli bacterium]